MKRGTFVYRNGKLVPKHKAAPLKTDPHFYVISDTMNPTRHMASGRVFDSKRAFREETRAHGCIEVGNEPLKPRTPIRLDKGQRRDHIRQAIYELRNGR
jgi:hypothetical protein